MQILVPDLLMTVMPQNVTAQNSHKQDTYDDGNQTQIAGNINANEHDASNAAYAQHCPAYHYQ